MRVAGRGSVHCRFWKLFLWASGIYIASTLSFLPGLWRWKRLRRDTHGYIAAWERARTHLKIQQNDPRARWKKCKAGECSCSAARAAGANKSQSLTHYSKRCVFVYFSGEVWMSTQGIFMRLFLLFYSSLQLRRTRDLWNYLSAFFIIIVSE